jgi:hypothetical protein
MTKLIIQKAKDLVHRTSATSATPSEAKMSSKYPKTCKAAVLPEIGAKLEIEEVAVEDPKQGEVLIKVHACGVCHSDFAVIEGNMGPL